MAKKKPRSFQTGSPFPRSTPEEVFDAFVDGTTLSRAVGAPVMGQPTVGAAWAIDGGRVKGTWLVLDRPTSIRTSYRDRRHPTGTPDATVDIRIAPRDGGGAMLTLIHADFQPPKNGYDTMMWWTQTVFDGLRAVLAERSGPAPLTPAAPPRGSLAVTLRAFLGGDTPLSTEAWTERLTAVAAKDADEPRWWKATDAALAGLQLWIRELAHWGQPVLVRAAVAVAEVALPTWQEAERTRPEGFDDLASFGGGEGEAPPAQIEAVRAWLAMPGPTEQAAVKRTTNVTRQLRFTDEDLGDLSSMRWAYALEASYAAALSVADPGSGEAELAALCAAEALAPSGEASIPGSAVAAVAEAVRSALVAWLGAAP